MPPLDPRCPHCGGAITQDGPATRCPWCGADLSPPPLDLEFHLDDPPAKEPPPEPEPVPLPDDAFDEVPLVKPAAKTPPVEELPEARPLPARRAAPPPPVYDAPRAAQTEPRRPEPKIGLALFVLFAMIVAIGCALSVIVAALWMGFQSVAKPRRSEAPALELRPARPVSRPAMVPITFRTPPLAPAAVEVC
jgi:hypothetical protein